MQDPGPAVGELTDGLTMGLVPSPQLVVVAPRAWRRDESSRTPIDPWRSARRRFFACRASTTFERPEALVTGDVAA